MTSFEVVASYGIFLQDFTKPEAGCLACGREISFHDISARATSDPCNRCYHLECFPAMAFLRADTEVVNRVFDRGNKEKVALWVRRHNAGFEFHRLAMIESAFGRRVARQHPESPLLCVVFAFLAPCDIAYCGRVSRQWYASSWSDQLWTAILKAKSLYVAGSANSLHPKLVHVLSVKSVCLWCNRAPVLSEVVIFCPVTHRPICRECRGSGDFLVTVAELNRRFRMTMAFLKGLRVVTFDYGIDTFTYFPMVVDAVVSHRVHRIDKLIQKVRENLPSFVLDACRSLKYSVSSGFPLLTVDEKRKMEKYVLALNYEDSCLLRDVTQELRSNFVPNINADN